MNFNGSGGLVFLVIAGLWLWVFVPSWFKRSEERSELKRTVISTIDPRQRRLRTTRWVFGSLSISSLLGVSATIFLAFSENFFWIVTSLFGAIFLGSTLIFRAAVMRQNELSFKNSRTRSSRKSHSQKVNLDEQIRDLISKNPADTRDWEPTPLPAPRQRIGELETPTLAEVVEIEDRVVKNPPALLDSTALDEILRRRRANG